MSVQDKVETLQPGTSPDLIALYLPIAESIAHCLEKYGVEMLELTQALIILHYIDQSTSDGQVVSERTRTGASATYAQALSGDGLASTKYGRQLLSLPSLACVQRLYKGARFARSIRPCH